MAAMTVTPFSMFLIYVWIILPIALFGAEWSRTYPQAARTLLVPTLSAVLLLLASVRFLKLLFLGSDYSGRLFVTIDVNTLLAPNWPLRTVAMIHFDGRGNMTSVDHVVVNGMPPEEEWRPNSGTYVVNPDCTASAVFSGPIPVHFVVVKNGKEFRGVVDGNAITLNGSRVN